jgi:hypothetical protein
VALDASGAPASSERAPVPYLDGALMSPAPDS